MKNKRRDNCGFSFFEVMIAMSIFVVVLIQISSVWSSFDKWIVYLTERSNVRREAKIAREILLSDLVSTLDISLAPPLGMRLILDRPSPNDIITYWNRGNFLIRSNDKTGNELLVALYCSNLGFEIKADDSTYITLLFKKGVSESTVNITTHPELTP